VVRKWYALTLKAMLTEVLQNLPEPRHATKKLAIVEELNRRGALAKKTYLTIYQRLMADEDYV